RDMTPRDRVIHPTRTCGPSPGPPCPTALHAASAPPAFAAAMPVAPVQVRVPSQSLVTWHPPHSVPLLEPASPHSREGASGRAARGDEAGVDGRGSTNASSPYEPAQGQVSTSLPLAPPRGTP